MIFYVWTPSGTNLGDFLSSMNQFWCFSFTVMYWKKTLQIFQKHIQVPSL